MTGKARKILLNTADTLERISYDLHNGDDIKRGVITRDEYIERITALRTAISVLRMEAASK